MSSTEDNPIGILGVEFLEYATPEIKKPSSALDHLFHSFAFEKIASHKEKNIHLYHQGHIHFIVNHDAKGFAAKFKGRHGPSLCSMALRTTNAQEALKKAIARGGKPVNETLDYNWPAIYGIGDSVIYFVDFQDRDSHLYEIYEPLFDMHKTSFIEGFGLQRIDHLTNNVPQGAMLKWQSFYETVFNFKETRYFDIRGEKTGLLSKVMTSPGGSVVIPINEPTDSKSQIQEYLDEYKGSGVQHIALATSDIIHAVASLRKAGVEFLDVPDTYYEALPQRLPNLTEDIHTLKDLKILADGDDQGYLLQIFTKNIIGPIFFEIIQRKNHDGFGEGNFQALFDAIERDQKRRGYL